jgi:DNA-binding beta-propeller fold protein YncE
MRVRVSSLFASGILVVATVAAGAQTITTQLTLAGPVQGIAANPVTNTIYVAVTNGAPTSDGLAVIDGSTDTVTTTVPVPNGAYIPAVNYLTNRIYVASCNFAVTPLSCFVTVVNGKTNQVIANIPVTSTSGQGLLGISADPITNQVYVSNASDNVIDIIDGFNNTITGKVALPVGAIAGSLAINPLNNLLYVPLGTGEVAIINPATKKIVSTVAVGPNNGVAAVNFVTGHVFVSSSEFGPSSVDVLNAKGALLADVAVGQVAVGVDVDPLTNLAFVSNASDSTVTVIDGKTNTAINTVGPAPGFYLAVNFGSQKVYVAGSTFVTVMTEK